MLNHLSIPRRLRSIIGIIILIFVAYILVSIIGGPYADALYIVNVSGASPDGEYLVVRRYEEPGDMPIIEHYVLHVESGDSWRMTEYYPLSEGKYDWASNSQQIVYVEDNHHIMVADADGGSRRRLATCEERCVTPTFSPDGHYILFYAINESIENALMIIELDSGDVHKVTDCERGCQLPVWLSDQNLIAVRTSLNNRDYYLFGDTVQLLDPETRSPVDGIAADANNAPAIFQALSPTLWRDAMTFPTIEKLNVQLDQRVHPIPYEIDTNQSLFGGEEGFRIRELETGKLIREVTYASIFRVEFPYHLVRLSIRNALFVSFICVVIGCVLLFPILKEPDEYLWEIGILGFVGFFACVAALWVYIEPGFNH